MIRSLRVRNLAVIQDLELEFGPGLNVLTGETGAGKSVLLDAVRLISGARVRAGAVREGSEEASAEAIFDRGSPLAAAHEKGLATADDAELLVSRSLPAAGAGRGRVRVNGSLATVSLLAELVGEAVEVASQAEHQQLLRPEVQSELLDVFGGAGSEREAVASLYREAREVAAEIDNLRTHSAERARRVDQLRAELEQIQELDPRPGEIEALELEHRRLAHSDRLAADTRTAHAALDADDGVRERLSRARSALRHASELDPELAPILEGLERAALEVEEGLVSLAGYGADLEADPARLAIVERRLSELARLQKRFGESVTEILAYRDSALEELDRAAGGDDAVAELERRREKVAGELETAALGLSERRRKAATELEQAVIGELRALDLDGAAFEVRLEPLRTPAEPDPGAGLFCGPHGSERAAFRLGANVGGGIRELKQAASGGELSRLYLALRNALRDAGEGRILVFDEVDAGIGGKTARRVGERLRALAERHQVLCITHLPQIAALAETHYRVSKRRRGTRTITQIEPIDGDERVAEIARMAGTGRATEATREHARELLRAGRKASSR